VPKHEAENAPPTRTTTPPFRAKTKNHPSSSNTTANATSPHRANERSEAESNERSEAVGRNDRTNAGRANKGGYGEG